MTTIVVGVDGSEAAQRALAFALAEARLREAELRAVSAWHVPAVVYDAGVAAASVDLGEFSKFAEASLASSLERAGVADSGVRVTSVLREGQPAEVLCEEARDAALLVVGSRGLGGVRSLLLGSVSQHCAQRSPCPVVIIPHDPGGEEADS